MTEAFTSLEAMNRVYYELEGNRAIKSWRTICLEEKIVILRKGIGDETRRKRSQTPLWDR
jgi:hypothetical protein